MKMIMETLFVDIGSNSIKSLLADFRGGKLVAVADRSEHSRISSPEGLKPDAAQIIADAVNSLCRRSLKNSDKFDVFCFGTSALRESKSANAVLSGLEKSGIEIRVLSGMEEAELSFEGATGDSYLNLLPDSSVVYGDLGGGSMEFVSRQNSKIIGMDSLPIGAVRLTNSFTKNGELDRAGLKDRCASLLKRIPRPNGGFKLVVAGGALSAARFILGNGEICEKRELSLEDFGFCLNLAEKLGAEGLSEKFGTPKNRGDILPAAFLCLMEVLKHFEAPFMVHTQISLRYGVANAYFKYGKTLKKI